MTNIRESALAYEGESKTRNIVELAEVSTDLDITEKTLKDREGKEFTLKVFVVDGEEYRIPDSVLKALKMILEDNPNLSKFKVKKNGTGLDTVYTVIPLV